MATAGQLALIIDGIGRTVATDRVVMDYSSSDDPGTKSAGRSSNRDQRHVGLSRGSVTQGH